MKKLISILLSLILLFALSACSDKNGGESSSSNAAAPSSSESPTPDGESKIPTTREELPRSPTIIAYSQTRLWCATYDRYFSTTVGSSIYFDNLDFLIGVRSDVVKERPETFSCYMEIVEIEDETMVSEATYREKNKFGLIAHKAGKTTVTVRVTPTKGGVGYNDKNIAPQPIECKFDIYVFEE